MRKSAKDQDEKGGGGGGGDDLGDIDIGGTGDPTLATGGPSVGTRNSKTKKAKVGLPWDVSSFYFEQVPEREDEEDEDEEEMTTATLQRLKNADERTKNMTPDEYLHWSECRQASFTFRKGKRFREWAGFGIVTDSKPNDDIVDILGFLTFEIVQTLTEEALRVKHAEDLHKKDGDGEGGADHGDEGEQRRKRRRTEKGLFDPPEEARAPVQPKHIMEAFRRLQKPEAKSRYMDHIPSGLRRQPLKLVRVQVLISRWIILLTTIHRFDDLLRSVPLLSSDYCIFKQRRYREEQEERADMIPNWKRLKRFKMLQSVLACGMQED